jgi:hypothetical protein
MGKPNIGKLGNWTGLWHGKTTGSAFMSDVFRKQTGPPPPPDITDKAVQDARRREQFKTGSGSRRNSFITGPMGDQTNIPVMSKSIVTGG